MKKYIIRINNKIGIPDILESQHKIKPSDSKVENMVVLII
jgi:hypothetical protein